MKADKENLCGLLQEERRGAFVRSRERFMENAERPGSYFLKSEKANAVYKQINAVRNKEGGVVNGDDVLPVFHDFYSELYACTSQNNDKGGQNILLNSLKEGLKPDQSEGINKPIDLLEIKNALSVMLKNKSPGMDGL